MEQKTTIRPVLVTGFDPFGGETINPAFEAVRLLPDVIGGVPVERLEVPTVFALAGKTVIEAVERLDPVMVVCVGQAGGRDGITPEKVAINDMESTAADNAGVKGTGLPVIPGRPTAYFSTLPLAEMVRAMQAIGLPAKVSYTAGTFVCNSLMYTLLDYLSEHRPDIPGGFIHVPFAAEQVAGKPEGTPFMTLPDIARGLEAAIDAALKTQNIK